MASFSTPCSVLKAIAQNHQNRFIWGCCAASDDSVQCFCSAVFLSGKGFLEGREIPVREEDTLIPHWFLPLVCVWAQHRQCWAVLPLGTASPQHQAALRNSTSLAQALSDCRISRISRISSAPQPRKLILSPVTFTWLFPCPVTASSLESSSLVWRALKLWHSGETKIELGSDVLEMVLLSGI